jgi:hypothetical protein
MFRVGRASPEAREGFGSVMCSCAHGWMQAPCPRSSKAGPLAALHTRYPASGEKGLPLKCYPPSQSHDCTPLWLICGDRQAIHLRLGHRSHHDVVAFSPSLPCWPLCCVSLAACPLLMHSSAFPTWLPRVNAPPRRSAAPTVNVCLSGADPLQAGGCNRKCVRGRSPECFALEKKANERKRGREQPRRPKEGLWREQTSARARAPHEA